MSELLESTWQASRLSEEASSSLAVLLTQIVDSHANILQRLADQDADVPPVPAVPSASASFQMTSSSSHQAHTSPAGKQAESGSGCAHQQHINSNDQHSPSSGQSADVATPAVELYPYQQELVERFMQGGNTVIFLPAGTFKAK